MDVRQLRCFVTVAEELHFGRAAARLHIAGPAVSQTIRSLERELGLTLFERTNRRVALTHAGDVLRTEARAVLERFDDLQAAMSRLRLGEAGRLRIGAVPALPPKMIPRLLAEFATQAPGIEVVVRAIHSRRTAAELLESSDLDLVLLRDAVDTPGIESTIVAREPIGVALHAGHLLARKPTLTATDLECEPLIAFARDTDPAEYDRIFDALAAAGLRNPRVIHESHAGAVEASLRLVEQRLGLSLKLQSEVDAFASQGITWKPLDDIDLDVVITAAWRRGRATPALQQLLPVLTAEDRQSVDRAANTSRER